MSTISELKALSHLNRSLVKKDKEIGNLKRTVTLMEQELNIWKLRCSEEKNKVIALKAELDNNQAQEGQYLINTCTENDSDTCSIPDDSDEESNNHDNVNNGNFVENTNLDPAYQPPVNEMDGPTGSTCSTSMMRPGRTLFPVTRARRSTNRDVTQEEVRDGNSAGAASLDNPPSTSAPVKMVGGHVCAFCEKRFKGRRALTWHQNKIHQTDVDHPYPCPCCQVGYRHYESLKRHVVRQHKEFNMLSCPDPTCNLFFVTKSKLDNHMAKKHEILFTEKPVLTVTRLEDEQGKL